MKSYKEDEGPTCFVHAYKQRMAKNDRLELVFIIIFI